MKRSVAALLDIPYQEIDKFKNDPKTQIVFGQNLDVESYEMYHRPAMSFREFLQRYGTESHRDVFGHDFWLEHTLPSNGHYNGRKLVVTDLRFANEAQRIKDLGGIIWYIDRLTDREAVDPHASETLDFRTDITINNRGTLGELYENVEEALSVVIR